MGFSSSESNRVWVLLGRPKDVVGRRDMMWNIVTCRYVSIKCHEKFEYPHTYDVMKFQKKTSWNTDEVFVMYWFTVFLCDVYCSCSTHGTVLHIPVWVAKGESVKGESKRESARDGKGESARDGRTGVKAREGSWLVRIWVHFDLIFSSFSVERNGRARNLHPHGFAPPLPLVWIQSRLWNDNCKNTCKKHREIKR